MLSAMILRLASRVVAVVAVLLACAAQASAVTAEELIELRRSGLGDEVLIALIETTGMASPVAADVVLRMRDSGLSDRVIAAAVRAVPPPPAQPPTAAAEPPANIALIGYGSALPQPAYVIEREVVYVPWVIPVRGRPGKTHSAQPYLSGDPKFGRFINDGFIDRPTPRKSTRRR